MSGLKSEHAKRMFIYCPSSGRLFWRIPRAGGRNNSAVISRAGDEAGTILVCPCGKYRRVRINNKHYLVHRLIWLMVYGDWPIGEIDHIDGNGLHNQIENLRDVDRIGNARNRARRKDNISGTAGVNWHKKEKVWYARLPDGKGGRITIGRFKDKELAVIARRDSEKELGIISRP